MDELEAYRKAHPKPVIRIPKDVTDKLEFHINTEFTRLIPLEQSETFERWLEEL